MVYKLKEIIEDNLPGGDFKYLKEKGRKLYDSTFTKKGLKKAGITAVALGLASCTTVDRYGADFAIHDACKLHGISPYHINTKPEKNALVSLNKSDYIKRAIDDYIDPKSQLKERQKEVLVLEGDELGTYLAAVKAIETLENGVKTGDSDLDKIIKVNITANGNTIMSHATDTAKMWIYGGLVTGGLFESTSLEQRYTNAKALANKFSGKQKEELTKYVEDIHKKVKSGELGPNFVDRIFNEFYKVMHLHKLVTGPIATFPYFGKKEIAAKLATGHPRDAYNQFVSNLKEDGIVIGAIESLFWFLLPVAVQQAREDGIFGGGSGRDGRTGGSDVGGGRDGRD